MRHVTHCCRETNLLDSICDDEAAYPHCTPAVWLMNQVMQVESFHPLALLAQKEWPTVVVAKVNFDVDLHSGWP